LTLGVVPALDRLLLLVMCHTPSPVLVRVVRPIAASTGSRSHPVLDELALKSHIRS